MPIPLLRVVNCGLLAATPTETRTDSLLAAMRTADDRTERTGQPHNVYTSDYDLLYMGKDRSNA